MLACAMTFALDPARTASDLEAADRHLQQSVAPIADRLDRDPEALRRAFLGLGERQLLTLKLGDRRGYSQFQQLVARYSGALAFLQAQHQSAAAFIAQGDNEALKADLPHMATGQRAIGVSFSHLRRRTIPVTAEPTTGGYRVSGIAPWVTGCGIFSEFILGAALPDGLMLLGLVPFADRVTHHKDNYDDTGVIRLGQPLELVAMQAAQTVTATFDRWLIPHDRVIRIQPQSVLLESTAKGVLNHAFQPLGCIQAALDVVAWAVADQEPTSERSWFYEPLNASYHRLKQAYHQCAAAIYRAEFEDLDTAFETKLRLRAEAIALVGRCTQAAIVATGGRANIAGNTAERVYREALVSAVAGQTPMVMAASLERLGAGDRLDLPLD